MPSPSDFTKVYDLRSDADRAQEIESGAVSWRKQPVPHGAIGSPEWWAAVESGSIPVKTQELLVTGSEWVDGVKMGEDQSLSYSVQKEDGQTDWWNPPDDSLQFQSGERLRVKSARYEGTGDFIIEIWKAPPADA